MSKPYQYSYYNRHAVQKLQSPVRSGPILSPQQVGQTIQSLKQQLKQKQSQINELSLRLQQQEKLLEQKQFVIKEKEVQLQYIHRENQELHQKVFQLNQKLHIQKADLKDTIKQEVSMLREEFNFMIKQSSIKNDIILQQKQKQFKRKEEDLKSVIQDLSERASSHSSSFYYEDSHSNIIKSKNPPLSYIQNRNQEFQSYEEKPSTANSNLRNSRDSYRSAQVETRILGSFRQSQVQQKSSRITLGSQDRGKPSFAKLLMKDPKQILYQANGQSVTGRFGYEKPTIMTKQPIKRSGQFKHQITRTSSKANIEQIINRSRKQLDQRNKKPGLTEMTKSHARLPPTNYNPKYRRAQNLDNSRDSRYGIDQVEQKRKYQKLKQISSLKMKVNMLKTQLHEEITFCQDKE